MVRRPLAWILLAAGCAGPTPGDTAPTCTPGTALTCVAGDAWSVDSCGHVEALVLDCPEETGCLAGGDRATCVDLGLRCQDTDHRCWAPSASDGYVHVSFRCEVENRGTDEVELISLALRPAEADDAESIEFFYLDDGIAPVTLPPGAWTAFDYEFAVYFCDEIDGAFEVEGDLEVRLGEAGLVLHRSADPSPVITVEDDWFACFPVDDYCP